MPLNFEFDEISTLLKSLVVAAGAVFWFSLKLLTEKPEQSTSVSGKLDFFKVGTTFNALLACTVSIVLGFVGELHFADIGTRRAFSADPGIACCLTFQIITFAIGALLLVVGTYLSFRTTAVKNLKPV
jgi:hypothetical protein